jgi:hypothetical protein
MSLALQTKANLLQAQHARDAAKRDLAAAEQQLQAGRATRTGLLQQLSSQCQMLMTAPAAAASSRCCGSQPSSLYRSSSLSTAPAVVGPEKVGDQNLAGQDSLNSVSGPLGAASCLQELSRLTGCSDEQALLLHVQAHVKAAASLQVAVAAQAQLEQAAHMRGTS